MDHKIKCLLQGWYNPLLWLLIIFDYTSIMLSKHKTCKKCQGWWWTQKFDTVNGNELWWCESCENAWGEKV